MIFEKKSYYDNEVVVVEVQFQGFEMVQKELGLYEL